MRFLRRRRVLATVSMLFQMASLSALVPSSCCLGTSAHMNPPHVACDGDMRHCQMAETTRPPCAMHHGGGGAVALQHAASPAPRKTGGECAMRAACGNQAAAFFTSLSQTGVLCKSFVVSDPASVAFPRSLHLQLILQFESPDAPPPRA